MYRRTFIAAGAFGAVAALSDPALASPDSDGRIQAPSDTLPDRDSIVETVRLVNDHWIDSHPDPGTNLWDVAAYFSGNMDAYRLTDEPRYLDYAAGWAQSHDYGLPDGPTTRNADNQCCGQTYLDLYELDPDPAKIAQLDESVGGMVYGDPDADDDWWWCDALHMAMPVFTRLGDLRGDYAYREKMFQLYRHAKLREGGGLYDFDDELWYRDGEYVQPGGITSPNGLPVFWSRGNGWAAAAHVKVLKTTPPSDARWTEYRNNLVAVCRSVSRVQREDGLWNVNLADSDHHPGPETSGTAFFAYAIAYGVNAGMLDREEYLPTLARAWNGMVDVAMRDDGFLGYIQGPGDGPDSSQPVTEDSTFPYGVGAFLHAGKEIAELAD